MVNYMRTSDHIVLPGCFNFDSQNDFTARAKIIMRIEYRGSKVPNSTGLTNLKELVEKSELLRPKVERREIKIGETGPISKEECAKEDDEENSEYEGDAEFIDSLKEGKEKACSIDIDTVADHK